MLRYTLSVLLASVVVLAGCSFDFKPNAVEGDTELAVIIEGAHTQEATPRLREALEQIILTPQEETQFTLHFAGDDSLARWSRWANVLLVGCLDSDDPVSQRIREMLKGEVLEGVQAGRYSVFRRENVWAKKQTVVFLVAPDKEQLKIWLADNGSELYSIFNEVRVARVTKALYAQPPLKDLSDSLFTAHGWWLDIPHDYSLVASHQHPGFIRLGREYPDRLLTVAWRQGEPEEVHPDTLLRWRNELGHFFADSVRVNPVWIRTSDVMIGDIPAIQVRGLWETFGSLGGGPFVAYILHSEGTLFLLDAQVFAPGKMKVPYVRQMEIILRSFRTSKP